MSVAAKQDFLDRLKASISCLPLQDQADILNDYEEHFRIGLENGKTEAEIAGSLGSPEELGASFVEENAQPVTAQEEIFSHSQTAPAPDSPQAAGPQSSPAPWQGQAEAAPQAHQQSQAEPEAPGFGSSQGAQHERTHHQSYKSQQAWPHERSQDAWQTHSFEQAQEARQPHAAQRTQDIYSAEPPQQPPYPPNEGNYSQPPYEQAGSKGGSSVRTGPLVAMILLTIFIMIPVFFGVIVGVSLGLACLCFALVLVSMILFSLTPFHFGFAMLGLALIFLSLLALCGLIGFLYGMVKAIIAYSRCFARVIRGKEAQA